MLWGPGKEAYLEFLKEMKESLSNREITLCVFEKWNEIYRICLVIHINESHLE